MKSQKEERKVLLILALVFGVIVLATSWILFINNASGVLALVAFLLGIIALIVNRKNKKMLTLVSVAIAVISFVIVLVSQPIYGAVLNDASDSYKGSTAKVSSSKKKKLTNLETLNALAKKSKSTNELYVTDKIKVGQDGDVMPGIYDLQITGGSGNITGERSSTFSGLYINWLGSSLDSGNIEYPSTIRVVLFEGDTLEFTDISKVKFTAVSSTAKNNNKLGIGNYVVGRDIEPGTYKLDTNATMAPEFENLGWEISIYNIDTDNSKEQNYNPGNTDVVVKLKEGEIITTNFDNTQYDVSGDTAKLIFTEVKQ